MFHLVTWQNNSKEKEKENLCVCVKERESVAKKMERGFSRLMSFTT